MEYFDSKVGTTQYECSGEVEKVEDKEEEERDEERNNILVYQRARSPSSFARGVLYEETLHPRKRERGQGKWGLK